MDRHDPTTFSQARVNVADRLAEAARERPDAIALAAAKPSSGWRTITFGELDRDATLAARGLAAMGVGPGKRIALLVKPSVEFVTLVFALLRTGATMVLVDAGLGRKNIVRCLASTEPDGFVAIPVGHALRVVKRKQFAKAKLNVTVGRRWFWGGETLESVKRLGSLAAPLPDGRGSNGEQSAIAHTIATDPAAIVFTSGSTGPPKGVLYTHETFVTQCAMIQAEYDIRPGDIDLACFPLFGLFNVACGVTTVLPEMDFSRPASCDAKKILAAANQWKVTQAFASPAVWDRVSRYCEMTGERIPTLKKILSCGAPVPAKVLRRTLACVHPDAQMHTPYGATEALPIATIKAQEILGETAAKTDMGAGVCVGRKFGAKWEVGSGKWETNATTSSDGEPPTVVGGGTFDWRVIRITDTPIATIDETEELPTGEIGELIVRGPQVSREYLANDEARMTNDEESRLRSSFVIRASSFHNAGAKIEDNGSIWHRMGDVGYFDAEGRFWYCGRKSQRVVTSEGTVFTECAEAVFNAHPEVTRASLIGYGDRGNQVAAMCVMYGAPNEQWPELFQPDDGAKEAKRLGCGMLATSLIQTVIPTPRFPVDARHNSKIVREILRETSVTDVLDYPLVHGPEVCERVRDAKPSVVWPPHDWVDRDSAS